MKYLLIALVATFVVTGCKTSDTSAPAPGTYNQSEHDRHALNRVSNNLRGNASSFGH